MAPKTNTAMSKGQNRVWMNIYCIFTGNSWCSHTEVPHSQTLPFKLSWHNSFCDSKLLLHTGLDVQNNKICLGEQVNSQQYQCLVHCRPQFWFLSQKKSKLQLKFERNRCYHWSGLVEEAVITHFLSLGCYIQYVAGRTSQDHGNLYLLNLASF